LVGRAEETYTTGWTQFRLGIGSGLGGPQSGRDGQTKID
jgi:hypothetical protein